MGSIPLFLIYAVIFRLAIITCGALSIVLGYRLFCRGVFAAEDTKSSFDARVLSSRFTLKNAAPGTFFALFGAMLVVVMLLQGNPSLTLDSLNRTSGTMPNSTSESASTRLTLRGQGTDTLKDATNQAKYYEEKGAKPEAIAAYENAVSTMAEPLNDLAWLYQSDGRLEEAASLSELAVAMRRDPRFLDTFAEIKFKSGDRNAAIKLMERAVALNPSPQLRQKLERFKNGQP